MNPNPKFPGYVPERLNSRSEEPLVFRLGLSFSRFPQLQTLRRRNVRDNTPPVARESRRRHVAWSRWTLPTVFLAACGLFSSPSARADAVIEWNKIMEETVLTTDPFWQTRSAAITQLAVFEAVNSITGDYEPYIEKIPTPAGASAETAAIAAAHHALAALHPLRAASLDALRAASLAAIPDGAAKFDGMAVGIAAADAILALRANDGSSTIEPYIPGVGPGDWQPTPPALAPAFRPGWRAVTPFSLDSSAQFRPGPPPSIESGRYARDYNEVKKVGALDSLTRPADRTDVARFYAVVLGIDCYNPAARQVSVAQGLSLSENARLFALLAMAVSDSLIASTDAKYHYNYWRPVTAIRQGETDGNRKTEPDASFLPLVTTPPFPSYPSNHASIGGAARAVLEHVLGERGHSITLKSAKIPAVVLNYSAWKQITDDIDDARIYGGIHFRFDQEVGARLGRRVGEEVIRHELRRTHGRKTAYSDRRVSAH